MALTGLSTIQKLILYNKIATLLSECPVLHNSLGNLLIIQLA